MRTLLFVGLGGGLGSILRYAIQMLVGRHMPMAFPLGTFLVNCSGCFLIGMFYSFAIKYSWFSPDWRLFLITGICGGYTTFSTFSYDGLNLIKQGAHFYFILYILGSVILGLLSTFAAMAIFK